MRSARQLVALIMVFAAFGCSSGGGSASAPTTPTASAGAGEGTVTVLLTDSPFDDAKAVLVTFTEVSAHRSGGGWETIPFQPPSPSRTCDLKKLVGAQDILGTGALPQGHYTQIRLMVSEATLYFDDEAGGPACAPAIAAPDGASAPLEIPSGEVKLNREFDVTSGGVTTITLDFEGERSIHRTGSGRFMLKPVIAVVSVQ